MVVDAPISDTKTVTFVPIVGTGDNTISLRVLNDNQPADGESAITLIVSLVDANNKPVSNAQVTFIPESDNVTIAGGETNARGEFPTKVTNEVVESFKVFPVFEGIVGQPKTITFVVPEITVVADLSVTVVNNDQPVNSKIEVRVVARDSNGQPVKDVPIVVRLPSNAGAAVAEPSRKNTDDNGFFKTEITSSEL